MKHENSAGVRRKGLLTKLALVAGLPTLALVFSAGLLIQRDLKTFGEVQTLTVLTHLSILSGNLVHELQKERGMTAIYVGSAGQRYSLELAGQREKAAEPLGRLDKALSENALPEVDVLNRWRADVRQILDGLAAQRRSISALEIPLAEATGIYTDAIKRILVLPSFLITLCSDRDIASRVSSYATLLEGKERAGRERALLSGILTSGSFTALTYRQFLTNVTEQATYLSAFQAGATEAQRAVFQESQAAAVSLQAADFKAKVLEVGPGRPLGLDPSVWYEAATGRINELKRVENVVADDLAAAAEALQNFEAREVFLAVAGTLLALVGTAVLAWFVVRGLNRSIREAWELARTIQSGDLRGQKEGRTSRDEVGELLISLRAMRTDLVGHLTQIGTTALELRQADVRLDDSMGETSKAIADISEILDQIQIQIVDQSASVEESDATVQQIAHRIEGLQGTIENQTVAVNQSSSAIEEMIANIRSITTNVEGMGREFEVLMVTAGEGRGKLTTAGDAVRSVENQSKGLREANQVIEELATATNLLSINAAIEAARGGAAGRGFAVVAQEIRKLANLSAGESQRISETIESILSAIGVVVRLVADAETAFAETLAHLVDLNRYEAEIRHSLLEQNTGSLQILQALEQIKGVSQRVNESSREIVLGSRSIAAEMHRLAEGGVGLRTRMANIVGSVSRVSDANRHLAQVGEESGRGVLRLESLIDRFQTQ